MEYLTKSNEAVVTLVRLRPRLADKTEKPLFITISPNAKTVIKLSKPISGKKLNTTYGAMPQHMQYNYCIKAFQTMYLKEFFSPTYVGTWELNKQGNVHLHILLVDKSVHNAYELKIFQRDIYNCETTQKNLHKGKGFDRMNNIVFVNDSVDERCKYMDKDHDSKTDLMKTKQMLNICSPLEVLDDVDEYSIEPEEDYQTAVEEEVAHYLNFLKDKYNASVKSDEKQVP